MNLCEYLNKLTNFGTKCALPTELFKQRTEESSVGDGAGGKSGVVVVKYTSESLSNEKREFKLLQDITMRALNVKTDNASIARFYKTLMVLVPKDFRVGDYETLKTCFFEWFLNFMDSVTTALSTKLLTERMTPSVRALLATLQTRCEQWAKQVKVDTPEGNDDGGKVVNVSIQGW